MDEFLKSNFWRWFRYYLYFWIPVENKKAEIIKKEAK